MSFSKEGLASILLNKDFQMALKEAREDFKEEMFMQPLGSEEERLAKLRAQAVNDLVGKLSAYAGITRGDFE